MKQAFSTRHSREVPNPNVAEATPVRRKRTPPPPWKNAVSQRKAKTKPGKVHDIEKVSRIASQPMLQRLAEDNDIRQIDFAVGEAKCDAIREKQIQENTKIKDVMSKERDYDFNDPNGINRKFWDTIDTRERKRQEFLLKEREHICKQYHHIMELKKLRDLKKKQDKEEISKIQALQTEEDRKTLERKREVQKRLWENINKHNSVIMENKNKRDEEQKISEMKSLDKTLQYQQIKAENERKWIQAHKDKEEQRRARYESVVADLSQRTAADNSRKDIWREGGDEKFQRIDEHKSKVIQEIKAAGVPEKLIYGASRKSNIIIKKAKASDPSHTPGAVKTATLHGMDQGDCKTNETSEPPDTKPEPEGLPL
ncbi:hypothetical protein JOB18_012370 [Solea senegalensis]|uniref:Trichohyalin-plectin-homology domain-containing protein n=1 Tax=Solea senegalensis TaxID=28829 RepID=A0AAV6RKL4_SOLSE|nr:hypothetical protein JOB18_012370 [Solea senegalensis]